VSDAHEAAEHGAEHVKTGLSKKLGPLPMGVWILAVGGGLVLAWFMRSRSSGDTTTDETVAPDTWDYGPSNGVGQTGYDTGTDTGSTASTPITTNEEWQHRAVQVLVGRLYDPVTVDRAIGDYLAGNALTTTERAIVNEAILAIGPPPISPPPPPTADQPPTTVTPPTTLPQPVGTPTPPITTRPPAKPAPRPAQKPTPAKAYPQRWKTVINGPRASYSTIAARYHLGISGQELYQYQLSRNAGRPSSTVATLRKRGANLIYPTGTTVLPYPKK
jgi:hypothetical protein